MLVLWLLTLGVLAGLAPVVQNALSLPYEALSLIMLAPGVARPC